MLTIAKLLELPEESVFATGLGLYPNIHDKPIRWVAKRGIIHDWAIYYDLEYKSFSSVENVGQKLYDINMVKSLVKCDEEAIKMYRF